MSALFSDAHIYSCALVKHSVRKGEQDWLESDAASTLLGHENCSTPRGLLFKAEMVWHRQMLRRLKLYQDQLSLGCSQMLTYCKRFEEL